MQVTMRGLEVCNLEICRFLMVQKIFCDASVCVQQGANTTQTEFGIFILTSPSHSLSSGMFFLGGYSTYPAPLEAEALALLLATTLVVAKNLQSTVFITDNWVLASASKRKDLLLNPGHWSLRPILVDSSVTTANMMHSISRIGRNTNTVADNLAKKARQTSIPSSCLFSCQSCTHSRNYAIQMALENFQWDNFCLISVICI